jgi:hypothetical protein
MRSERIRVGSRMPRRAGSKMTYLLAVIALSVAGCGGGSGSTGVSDAGPTWTIASSTPVGPPLTRAQLIARADAICKRRNTAIDAVKLQSAKAAGVVRFASQSAALEQAAFLELGRLSPPTAMAANWQQILAYDRTLLEAVLDLGEYGKHRDARAISALAHSTEAVKRRLLAAASRDGFKYCSRVR